MALCVEGQEPMCGEAQQEFSEMRVSKLSSGAV